jgi:NADH-quinone oxidoreductase subunit G
LSDVEPSAAATAIAASLQGGQRRAIFLGNQAEQHAEASQLYALAQALAELTGATLGCLGEAANSVGGYLAGALPQSGGLDAQAMLAQPRRAYLLLNAEPALIARTSGARRTGRSRLRRRLAVLARRGACGRRASDRTLHRNRGDVRQRRGCVQRFNGVVVYADARPGWKVLRVLDRCSVLPD